MLASKKNTIKGKDKVMSMEKGKKRGGGHSLGAQNEGK